MNQLSLLASIGKKAPNLRIIAFFFMCAAFVPQTVFAEYVFLKDGKIIEGKIVNDEASAIAVMTPEKKHQTFPRNKVVRIIYTKLYLGKVYVRMTNGQILEGYQIDEDQDSYVMRKELNSPEEFRIARGKVMFIARSNPTDLAGKVDGLDSVKLTWSSPFVPAKRYKIYIKKSSEKEFKLADESSDVTCTLHNLSTNTKYSIYVTAIDKDNEESLPTDIIELLTGNVPPFAPGNITGTIITVGKGKTDNKALRLTWNEARDSDGVVKEYRVYTTERLDKYQLVWKGNVRTCDLPMARGNKYNNAHSIMVTSVDERNGESKGGYYPKTMLDNFKETTYYVDAMAVYPYGDLAKFTSLGVGGRLGLHLNNFNNGFLAYGFEGGYIYWKAKDNVSTLYSLYAGLTVAYVFNNDAAFKIIPKLFLGVESITATYTTKYLGDSITVGSDPRAELSFEMQYRFENNLLIRGAVLGAVLYESKSPGYYAGVTIGLGYNYE